MDCKTCPECGAPFTPKVPRRGSEQVYCSPRCRNRAAAKRLIARAAAGFYAVPDEKYCPGCGETKPASGFQSRSHRADGLSDYCRSCRTTKCEATREKRRTRNQTGAKVCPACNESRPMSDFGVQRKADDGYTRRCRACLRAARKEKELGNHEPPTKPTPEPEGTKRRQRRHNELRRKRAFAMRADPSQPLDAGQAGAEEWYTMRPRERLAFLHFEKSRRGCRVCGEFHPACLDWHHIDPSQKLFNISEATTNGIWSWAEVSVEIQKCEVVCRNCHARLHWEEKHGAGAMRQANLPLPSLL